MIATPIEAAIEQQRDNIIDLDMAIADATADLNRAAEAVRDLVRQRDDAHAHLQALLTFAEGGPEGPAA
jgi:hypothetical protein